MKFNFLSQIVTISFRFTSSLRHSRHSIQSRVDSNLACNLKPPPGIHQAKTTLWARSNVSVYHSLTTQCLVSSKRCDFLGSPYGNQKTTHTKKNSQKTGPSRFLETKKNSVDFGFFGHGTRSDPVGTFPVYATENGFFLKTVFYKILFSENPILLAWTAKPGGSWPLNVPIVRK